MRMNLHNPHYFEDVDALEYVRTWTLDADEVFQCETVEDYRYALEGLAKRSTVARVYVERVLELSDLELAELASQAWGRGMFGHVVRDLSAELEKEREELRALRSSQPPPPPA